MTYRYGLPTFPIADGMWLGIRSREEYTWLLNHGSMEYPTEGGIRRFRLEQDVVTAYEYRLSRGFEEEPLPESSMRLPDFLDMLERVGRQLLSWQWYGYKEEDA